MEKFEMTDQDRILMLEEKIRSLEKERAKLQRKITKLEKQLAKTPEEIELEKKRERRKELVKEYWWLVLPFTGLVMVVVAYILRVKCGFDWYNGGITDIKQLFEFMYII